MAEVYPVIDYEDMIDDLNDDIEGNFIKADSTLYIVRQKTPVFCEALGAEVCPVIDYFYEFPRLFPEIKQMTVDECKKITYDAIDRAEDDEMRAALHLLAEDLKDYTKGNPGRNERTCKVVFTAEDLYPVMVYYDSTDAADSVEAISVTDLLEELNRSSGQ